MFGQLKVALLPEILVALNDQWDQKWKPLEARITALEAAVAKHEEERSKYRVQHEMAVTGKQNNLLVSGIEEKEDEDPLQLIKTMSDKLEVDIKTFTAKRVGVQKQNKQQPRPILVSMSNHWDKRKLYAARVKLRLKGMPQTFINEDLFKLQSEVFYYARKLKQDKLIKTTWTSDGSVFIRTTNGVDFLIGSVDDIRKAVPDFNIAKYKK